MSTQEHQNSNKRRSRYSSGAHHGALPKRTSGRVMLYVMLGLVVAIGLFMAALYPVAIETTDHGALIKIPANATSAMVSDSVSKYFGPKFGKRVVRLAKLRGSDFANRHGAYEIPEGTSALGAMLRLTSGGQTPIRITINGFRSLPLLIDRVSNKLAFPADSLNQMLNDRDFLAKYGLTPESAMALFVDDTYEVYWTSSARHVLEKIGDNYLYLWNPDNKARAAEIGLTPGEVMTIASIVDEESNLKSEKGTIGQLYINRLHHDMKLQADPTVRFALGDFTLQRISNADLKTESPYNTYLHKGLPPGPIRTTSAATVQSILDAPPNNFYYMCAKEDFSGGHNFAERYETHLENAERYRAALDRKGITR